MFRLIKIFRLYLFTFVTCAVTIVSAQSYKAVKTDATYYFYDSTSRGIFAGRIDSIAQEGSDTQYFGMRQIREISYICYIPDGASWLGDVVMEKPGGIFQFVLYSSSPADSAHIYTILSQATLGEAWHFYNIHAAGHYLEATVTQISQSDFIGITDSVKTITLQRKDASGLEVDDPVNGQKILLSKNYGLIRLPQFDAFNTNRNFIDLCGKTNPLTGITNLTFTEVFDFQPGDELHVIYDDVHYSGFGPHDEGSIIQVFLEKLPESTNEVLKYRVAECKVKSHYSGTGYPEITHTEDTTTVIYDISSYFSDFWELTFEPYESYIWTDMSIYLSSNRMGLSPVTQMNMTGIPWKIINANGILCKWEDECWSSAIIDGYIPIYTYLKGLGGPFYYQNGISTNIRHRLLVYYKKGTDTWGTPLSCDSLLQVGFNQNAMNQQATIYPNPTFGEIRISVPDNVQLPGRLEVFDVSGRLHSRFTLNNKETSVELKDLPPGLYIYKLTSVKGNISHGKLIRR